MVYITERQKLKLILVDLKISVLSLQTEDLIAQALANENYPRIKKLFHKRHFFLSEEVSTKQSDIEI